jgi:hypothetical protein
LADHPVRNLSGDGDVRLVCWSATELRECTRQPNDAAQFGEATEFQPAISNAALLSGG